MSEIEGRIMQYKTQLEVGNYRRSFGRLIKNRLSLTESPLDKYTTIILTEDMLKIAEENALLRVDGNSYKVLGIEKEFIDTQLVTIVKLKLIREDLEVTLSYGEVKRLDIEIDELIRKESPSFKEELTKYQEKLDHAGRAYERTYRAWKSSRNEVSEAKELHRGLVQQINFQWAIIGILAIVLIAMTIKGMM